MDLAMNLHSSPYPTCPAQSIVFMGLVEFIIRSQCELSLPDRPIDVKTLDDEYDFIVVGAGAGGSVVASRLSEVLHWKVLLLEAGGHEAPMTQVPSMESLLRDSDVTWQYRAERQRYTCRRERGGACPWPRGKSLGGSTNINGMMYVRGNGRDYDRWAELGNDGWSYEDVLPYFIKSEDNRNLDAIDKEYHGKGGYLPVQRFNYKPKLADVLLEAGKELGLEERDLNGEKQTGIMQGQAATRDGMRVSASKAFLHPVRHRKNLHVALDAHVIKVLVDATKRAYGVRFLRDGKIREVRAAKEVILSAGAVGSPQLLMLSGIGDKTHLAHHGINVIRDLKVGHNLQDHVGLEIHFFTDLPPDVLDDRVNQFLYLRNRTGPYSSPGIGQVTGFAKTRYADKSEDYPDLQLYYGWFPGLCRMNKTMVACAHTELSGGLSISPVVLRGESRGKIQLRSPDPFQHPEIHPNYLSEERDLQVLLEGVDMVLGMLHTKAFQNVRMKLLLEDYPGCEDFTFGTLPFWECAVKYGSRNYNHPAGTVKMGPKHDPDAVVDPHLRVYGVRGLRVVDASIMPVLVSGNPVAATIMIGEKGSDMIKQSWRCSNFISGSVIC